MASPWRFRQCGESGLPMSELWTHLPRVADEPVHDPFDV